MIIKNLKIEKLVYRGFGLAFSQRNPVFVYHAVPGDVIDAEESHKRGKATFASIHKIIFPSPRRIDPGCSVFSVCGGCDWLNITYAEQINQKQIILNEIFQNGFGKILPIEPSPQSDHYRNKCFFPLEIQKGKPEIGMYAKRSRKVIPHDQCRLLPGFFSELARQFLDYITASGAAIYDPQTNKGSIRYLGIRYARKTDELLVIIVAKNRKLPFTDQLVRSLRESYPNIKGIILNINGLQSKSILGDQEKILYGREFYYEELAGKKIKLNYKSFFQINNAICEKLFAFIKEQTKNSRSILDAYCGSGAISVYIAEEGKKIIGIDSDSDAIRNANENALENDLPGCQFLTGFVENEISRVSTQYRFDTIIFDPPRSGLAQNIFTNLPVDLKKIIYISCDPQTQKRDIQLLIKEGFHPMLRKAFDMFPHTFHIENVIVLEK